MTQISERTLNPPRRRRPRQSLPPLSSFPLPCGTLLSQWKWERPRHGLGHYLPFIAALQVGCRMLSLSQSVERERQRKMPNEKKILIFKTSQDACLPIFFAIFPLAARVRSFSAEANELSPRFTRNPRMHDGIYSFRRGERGEGVGWTS